MRHYLVVANQTLGDERLEDEVRARLAAGPGEFHIIVPATPPKDHLTWTEGEAGAIAQRRLDRALARFRVLGAEVHGEVGDADPMQAIGDALLEGRFDELILSTLPPGPSRWLKEDLPRRVERSFDLKVTHVIGRPAGETAPG